MSKKLVCRVHGHTLQQCRCPCPDQEVLTNCNEWCPDYGRPPQKKEVR